jgi:hypothetical protein
LGEVLVTRLRSRQFRLFVVATLIVAFVCASVIPALASKPYVPKKGSKTRKALLSAARAKAPDPGTVYKVYELWVYKGYAVGNMVKYPEATPHTKYSFENNIYIWKKKAGKWKVVSHFVGDVGETSQTDAEIRAGYIKMYKKLMVKHHLKKALRKKLKFK